MKYKIPLSIFLIKNKYTNFEEILDENYKVERLDVKNHIDIDGVAFIGENKTNKPDWNIFLNDLLIDYDFQITKSTRAVLFIRRQGRIFAFTFGFGRHLIDEEAYVRNFGLRVILNNAERNSIKSIDSTVIDEKPFHNRTQASQASSFEEFNLTDIRTMFRGIIAESNNKLKYGNIIKGKDDFQIDFRFKLNELNNLCDMLIEDYESDNFVSYFPEVDRIKEMKDPEIVNELNKRLINNFINKQNTFLIVPDVIDWMSTDGFRYTSKGHTYTTPSLDEFWSNKTLNTDNLTLETLTSHHLFQIHDNSIIQKWSIKNCISTEVIYKDKLYVFSIGEWFEIDHNLINSVNNYIKEIPKCNIKFPKIDGLHEKYANILFENEVPNLFNMDRNNMTIDGDKYEVCDLLSKNKKLIHVKWWSSSATLSHLFSQGKVSAEILAHNQKQREKINEKISQHSDIFTNIIKNENYLTSDYTIVYAIIYEGTESIEDRLPFFSKVNLKQSVNELKYLGYNVELAHIHSTSDRLSTEENNKVIKGLGL